MLRCRSSTCAMLFDACAIAPRAQSHLAISAIPATFAQRPGDDAPKVAEIAEIATPLCRQNETASYRSLIRFSGRPTSFSALTRNRCATNAPVSAPRFGRKWLRLASLEPKTQGSFARLPGDQSLDLPPLRVRWQSARAGAVHACRRGLMTSLVARRRQSPDRPRLASAVETSGWRRLFRPVA